MKEKTKTNLLRISSTLQAGKCLCGANCSQEDWLELVHTSICEEESSIVMWDY